MLRLQQHSLATKQHARTDYDLGHTSFLQHFIQHALLCMSEPTSMCSTALIWRDCFAHYSCAKARARAHPRRAVLSRRVHECTAHRGAEVSADQLEVRGHLRADLPVIQAGLVVVFKGLLASAAAGGAAGGRRPQGRPRRSGTVEPVALAKRPAAKHLSMLSGLLKA